MGARLRRVFLVVDHDYEHDEILGAYATRSLAEAWQRAKSARPDMTEDERDAAYDAGDTEVYRRHGDAVTWERASIDEHGIIADLPDTTPKEETTDGG